MKHFIDEIETQNHEYLTNITDFMSQMLETIENTRKLFTEMMKEMQKVQETTQAFLELERNKPEILEIKAKILEKNEAKLDTPNDNLEKVRTSITVDVEAAKDNASDKKEAEKEPKQTLGNEKKS